MVYLDALRVLAIGAVVLGHWLLIDIIHAHGTIQGRDALQYVGWGGWLTLLFQVMPVFFLVGGYVNAGSWCTHHEDEQATWAGWVHARASRLLRPTAVYVGCAVTVVAAAEVAGVSATLLDRAGWLVALHLWFLPTYLLMIVLTPVMVAAQQRYGATVPIALALGAALTDVGVVGAHLPVIGFANFLFVWGSFHQWGIGWRNGMFVGRHRPVVLTALGVAATAVLVGWGPFPIDMIGTGERAGNNTPPSVALLSFAAVQTGLVLLAQPAATRLLERGRLRRWVDTANPFVINVYLWHMAPVILVAATLYPTGLVPQPGIGSWQWWILRPAWFAVLGVLLVPLVVGITRLEQPLARVRAGIAHPDRLAPVLVGAGLTVSGWALARLALEGFAPDGRLPLTVLAAFAAGLVLVAAAAHHHSTGRVSGVRRASPHDPRSAMP